MKRSYRIIAQVQIRNFVLTAFLRSVQIVSLNAFAHLRDVTLKQSVCVTDIGVVENRCNTMLALAGPVF